MFCFLFLLRVAVIVGGGVDVDVGSVIVGVVTAFQLLNYFCS